MVPPAPFSVWKYHTLENIEGDIVSKGEMGCRIHATPRNNKEDSLKVWATS